MAGYLQQPGGLGAVAAGARQSFANKPFLDRFQRNAFRGDIDWSVGRGVGPGMKLGRQAFQGNASVGGEHHRTLNKVLQLSNITRPIVALKSRKDFRLDNQFPPLCITVDKEIDQKRDLLLSIPQRRDGNRHHAQAVVKVLTE